MAVAIRSKQQRSGTVVVTTSHLLTGFEVGTLRKKVQPPGRYIKAAPTFLDNLSGIINWMATFVGGPVDVLSIPNCSILQLQCF